MTKNELKHWATSHGLADRWFYRETDKVSSRSFTLDQIEGMTDEVAEVAHESLLGDEAWVLMGLKSASDIPVTLGHVYQEAGAVSCPQCGDDMFRTKIYKFSSFGRWFGLILALISLPLLWLFPAGTFLGIVLIVAACGMGTRKIKVWKCRGCGYFEDRR